VRRTAGMEEAESSGIMIERNPGVSLIWISKSYKVWSPGPGQVLLTVGEPLELSFWCEGRAATRDEILHSVETGLPLLRETLQLEKESERDRAASELQQQIDNFMRLIPA